MKTTKRPEGRILHITCCQEDNSRVLSATAIAVSGAFWCQPMNRKTALLQPIFFVFGRVGKSVTDLPDVGGLLLAHACASVTKLLHALFIDLLVCSIGVRSPSSRTFPLCGWWLILWEETGHSPEKPKTTRRLVHYLPLYGRRRQQEVTSSYKS